MLLRRYNRLSFEVGAAAVALLCASLAQAQPASMTRTASGDTPYRDKNFSKEKTIILYCASGGRAALAGKVLKDMGYSQVYNMGGFKDWADSGGPTE